MPEASSQPPDGPQADHGSMMDRFESEPSSLVERMLADACGTGYAQPNSKVLAYVGDVGPDSMAMTGGSHTLLSSTDSKNVPSLSNDSSHSPSLSDSDSAAARTSDVPLVNEYILEDDHGVLIAPQTEVRLECPFDFLGCHRVFLVFGVWFSHSMSHFGGGPPPDQAICCFCSSTFHNAADPWRCWETRMRHVEQEHKRGCSLSTSQPDFNLLRHLQKLGIITEDELKRLGDVCEPVEGHGTANEAEGNPPDGAGGYVVLESREEIRRHRRLAASRRSGAGGARDRA